MVFIDYVLKIGMFPGGLILRLKISMRKRNV